MNLERMDHVQLAMPAGEEKKARAFYRDALGLPELAKPSHLAVRGGAWFESDDVKVHLGVDINFVAAKKAHPAFIVRDLAGLIERCENGGYEVVDDEPLEGYNRVYIFDPFGRTSGVRRHFRGIGDMSCLVRELWRLKKFEKRRHTNT